MPKLRLSFGDRSLAFTPLGTRYTVVCLLLGVAAVNSGSNLLYLVVAMMLSMMLISGVLSELALRRLSSARSVPDEIYAGSPFTVRYAVGNGKRRIPSYALDLEEYYPDGSRGPAVFVLKLPPGGRTVVPATVTVGRRGAWAVSGVEIGTSFPFGLFRKTRVLAKHETALVYPAIRPLPSDVAQELAGGMGETTAPRKGQGTEVRSLREYQSYDEARLIHWKSSARLSTLMAKEFESTGGRAVTVLLDNLQPKAPDKSYSARFENGVGLAASIIHHLLFDTDRPVALLTRDAWIPAGVGRGQFVKLMDALARVGPADAGAGLPEQDAQAEKVMSAGPCVLVVVARGDGWARHSGLASVVLEASDEV